MESLKPDWTQKRPTSLEAREMCQVVPLEVRQLKDPRLDSVLNQIRGTHQSGGALFASFYVGPSEAFDWFASRNRLLEFGILRRLLDRAEVTSALPELEIQPSRPDDRVFSVRKLKEFMSSKQLAEMMKFEAIGYELRRRGIDEEYKVAGTQNEAEFRETSSFLFDGELAQSMYAGGVYTIATGDGRVEKEKSLAFCEALFNLRFPEVLYYSSRSDWTPWFENISRDWTAILFDRRTRALSILAITDSD